MLLIITPFKNEEFFILDYLKSLKAGFKINNNFEVILIDDNSTDSSYQIVFDFCKHNKFVKLEKSKSTGKVAAINQGLQHINKKITHLKFCDADDLLTEYFFLNFDKVMINSITVHDLEIVDQSLKTISKLKINPLILSDSFNSISNGIIIPKATWTIPICFIEYVFIPDGILFEDFWFSYNFKKKNLEIIYVLGSFYLYRQNSGQTFGGVLVNSKSIEEFRIQRLLSCYNYLINLDPNTIPLFSNLITFLELHLSFNFSRFALLFFSNRYLFFKFFYNFFLAKYFSFVKLIVWKFR